MPHHRRSTRKRPLANLKDGNHLSDDDRDQVNSINEDMVQEQESESASVEERRGRPTKRLRGAGKLKGRIARDKGDMGSYETPRSRAISRGDATLRTGSPRPSSNNADAARPGSVTRSKSKSRIRRAA